MRFPIRLSLGIMRKDTSRSQFLFSPRNDDDYQKTKKGRLDSPFPSQFPPTLLKPFLSHISLPQTLYEILLYPSRGSNQTRDHLVLGEVAEDLAKTRGNEVGGVAEEDCRSIRWRTVPIFRVVFRTWVGGRIFFLLGC